MGNLVEELDNNYEEQRRQLAESRQAAYDAEPEVDYAPPDPNTKITWPRMMAGQIDAGKLPAVWPNNINRLKTIQKGRRISKEQCCDNPEALRHWGAALR